jgi:hypothetical protein
MGRLSRKGYLRPVRLVVCDSFILNGQQGQQCSGTDGQV